MNFDKTQEHEMYARALKQVLAQAGKIDGRLSAITLQQRYAPKVGKHIHGTARVTQQISVTVMENDHESESTR